MGANKPKAGKHIAFQAFLTRIEEAAFRLFADAPASTDSSSPKPKQEALT
jgi:hypothetical protein